MSVTADSVKNFYNNHFFNGDQPIQRVANISFTDGAGTSVKLPPLQMNGTRLIDLSVLNINRDTPIVATIKLSDDKDITLPALLLDKGKVSIELLCSDAYKLLSVSNETEAPAEEKKEEEDFTLESSTEDIVIDTADFDEIMYGRTAKSQKKYYIEVLKEEAAEREGVKYRVYRFDDNELMNPIGPVARGVVKQYEISHGLRKK
jgi:hypothetical protein